MTDSTTTAAGSPPVAVTGTPIPEVTASTPESTAPAAAPARRWKTLTVAIVAIVALVLGLAIGAVGGWAIATAQRPQFTIGEFPGGPGGDGEFQPPGDGQFPGDGTAPQRGDGTTDDGAATS